MVSKLLKLCRSGGWFYARGLFVCPPLLTLLQSSVALGDGSWGCASLHPRLSPFAPSALLQRSPRSGVEEPVVAELLLSAKGRTTFRSIRNPRGSCRLHGFHRLWKPRS